MVRVIFESLVKSLFRVDREIRHRSLRGFAHDGQSHREASLYGFLDPNDGRDLQVVVVVERADDGVCVDVPVDAPFHRVARFVQFFTENPGLKK